MTVKSEGDYTEIFKKCDEKYVLLNYVFVVNYHKIAKIVESHWTEIQLNMYKCPMDQKHFQIQWLQEMDDICMAHVSHIYVW